MMLKRILDTIFGLSINDKLKLETKEHTGTSNYLDTLGENECVSEASRPISEIDVRMIISPEYPKYQKLDRNLSWYDNKLNDNKNSGYLKRCIKTEDKTSSTFSEAKHNMSLNKKSLRTQLRIDTININRQSEGWWSILTSPFLSHPISVANPEQSHCEANAFECSKLSLVDLEFKEGLQAKLCRSQEIPFSNENTPLRIVSTADSHAIFSGAALTKIPADGSSKLVEESKLGKNRDLDPTRVQAVKHMPSKIYGISDNLQYFSDQQSYNPSVVSK